MFKTDITVIQAFSKTWNLQPVLLINSLCSIQMSLRRELSNCTPIEQTYKTQIGLLKWLYVYISIITITLTVQVSAHVNFTYSI